MPMTIAKVFSLEFKKKFRSTFCLLTLFNQIWGLVYFCYGSSYYKVLMKKRKDLFCT